MCPRSFARQAVAAIMHFTKQPGTSLRMLALTFTQSMLELLRCCWALGSCGCLMAVDRSSMAVQGGVCVPLCSSLQTTLAAALCCGACLPQGRQPSRDCIKETRPATALQGKGCASCCMNAIPEIATCQACHSTAMRMSCWMNAAPKTAACWACNKPSMHDMSAVQDARTAAGPVSTCMQTGSLPAGVVPDRAH